MQRVESSTGFTQLRVQDGLADGNSNSVEDFLSLVASGDIPHQDPHMLNVPLQKVMQQTGVKRAQQHLLALASQASLVRLAESSTNLSEMTALSNKRKLDDTDIEKCGEST